MEITHLSPLVNLAVSVGSIVSLYIALNNKIIKAESKINELESRLNRKDKYDDDLKRQVNDIQQLLTEVATMVKSKLT
ncbi:hypothetical protein [Flectobacillus longus]|uniref:hypothetical protein n=1 Tax=Flectobacillus longus TaxID=2984207 RepID=UPI0024B6EAF3|nr:hypothetical protein [Flectobacillus longus]MDI9878906.1 hypothetical protein [Flectobacillus longus]